MKSAVVLVILTAALSSFVASTLKDRQIVALQAHADSVAEAADAAAAQAISYADSLRRVSDSLATVEFAAKLAVNNARRSAGTARQAVMDARTAGDSIVALVAVVATQDTVIAAQSLALTAADAQIATERLRGDSLEIVIGTLHRDVTDLHKQIAALNGHALPQWARISLEVVRTGLAVKGAVDLVSGR